MPKRALSKLSAPQTNAPCRVRSDTLSSPSAAAPPCQREAGTSLAASTHRDTTAISLAGACVLAGSRQLMPRIATAALAGFSMRGVAGAAAAVPLTPAGCDSVRCRMCCSSCRRVGWSKISVSGRSVPSPRRAASRLRTSTAPSESSPASISGASASTPGSNSCTTSRTTSDASLAIAPPQHVRMCNRIPSAGSFRAVPSTDRGGGRSDGTYCMLGLPSSR